MRLPYLQPHTERKRQTVRFGGLNYGEQAAEGEISEALNLSTRLYPSLTQRLGRFRVSGDYVSPTALFLWQGKLVVVDGATLYYDGESMGTISEGEKQFAVVNTKLCIFPDQKYLDLESKVLEDLGAVFELASGTSAQFSGSTLTFEQYHAVQTNSDTVWNLLGSSERHRTYFKTYTDIVWKGDGTYELTGEQITWLITARDFDRMAGRYVLFRQQETENVNTLEPNFRTVYWHDEMSGANKNDIETWREDTSYEPHDVRGYYGRLKSGAVESQDSGGPIQVTYQFEVIDGRLGNTPLSGRFKAGDRVDITGASNTSNNQEGAAIQSVADYSITFQDVAFTSETATGGVMVRRKIPKLEYICESENRLWGCEGHTIHASALGDPTNFFTFAGVSTDSYSVAVGSDGAFTGCAAYSGDVLFFKERVLHKLIGAYPAEYAMYTYDVPGIQDGCHKSAVVINEVLYYKARDGVYAYTGGRPYCVSGKLGVRAFDRAVAGTDGCRYSISMRELGTLRWGLYVYDPTAGLWTREDDARVVDFAAGPESLYFLTGGQILYQGDEGSHPDPFPWMAQFAPFYDGTQSRKRHNRLLLRLELPPKAWALAEVRRDNGPWEAVWRGAGAQSNSFRIPILPRRCDRMEVRLSGEGGFVLRGMTWEYAPGGEG